MKAHETLSERRTRARAIVRILRREFPRPVTPLRHESPFQLLVATILSAQCTDERVNKVTPELFAKYPTVNDFARASQAELERDIHSTGFFRMKAKNIIACSNALIEGHGGNVPEIMEALVKLPGVGRKTANVVLGQSFGKSEGVVVDTHVHRLARRLGLTDGDDPISIEADLMEVLDRKSWIDAATLLIFHGRRTCIARKPKCAECPIAHLCPSAAEFLPSK